LCAHLEKVLPDAGPNADGPECLEKQNRNGLCKAPPHKSIRFCSFHAGTEVPQAHSRVNDNGDGADLEQREDKDYKLKAGLNHQECSTPTTDTLILQLPGRACDVAGKLAEVQYEMSPAIF